MAKKVIVGGRIESKEVGGIVTGAAEILDDTKGKKQSVINQETDAEMLRLDQSKQNNLTFDNVPTEGSNNPVKSAGVYEADKALSDAIEAILLLIPSAASALNKLVDMAMMNSSISTATATFKGTYNVVTDLGLTIDATHEQIAAKLGEEIETADNNDYAFVQIPVSAESTDIRRTERYKFNGTAWGYEYDLNTSGFTAAQWAAINSGITLALVGKLIGLPTSSELMALLGQKQDTLTFDNIPTSGSANPVKSGGVYSAINDEKTARELLAQSVEGINGRLGNVEEVIPSGAAANNKLVANSSMEAYVASIIQNITASFTIATADGHINLTLTQTNGQVASLTLTSSDIASAQALTALTGRVSTAEGNITSITGRISTAESDIVALQALYNALQQSAPQVIEPTDTWPVANPSGTVIYRVIDRGNTPPQYYSDYMWNGTSFVLMATYNNAIDPRPKKASQNLVTSGGVFDNMGALDVSELNATENPHTLAQYVDLSAALAAIPTDYQKGGMTIKFVQSSDNKYVKFFCMADSFTTDVTQWQGVDDEPTDGSNNIVESGGVYKVASLSSEETNHYPVYITYSTGAISNSATVKSYVIKNRNYKQIGYKISSNSNTIAAVAFFSDNIFNSESYIQASSIKAVVGVNEGVVNVPDNCKYICIANLADYDSGYVKLIRKDNYLDGFVKEMYSTTEIVRTYPSKTITSGRYAITDTGRLRTKFILLDDDKTSAHSIFQSSNFYLVFYVNDGALRAKIGNTTIRDINGIVAEKGVFYDIDLSWNTGTYSLTVNGVTITGSYSGTVSDTNLVFGYFNTNNPAIDALVFSAAIGDVERTLDAFDKVTLKDCLSLISPFIFNTQDKEYYYISSTNTKSDNVSIGDSGHLHAEFVALSSNIGATNFENIFHTVGGSVWVLFYSSTGQLRVKIGDATVRCDNYLRVGDFYNIDVSWNNGSYTIIVNGVTYSGSYTGTISENCYFGKSGGNNPAVDAIVFTYRINSTIDDFRVFKKTDTKEMFQIFSKALSERLEQQTIDIDTAKNDIVELIKSKKNYPNPFFNKPFFYHFNPSEFIKDANGDNIIPSETVFDVQIAKRLGFDIIEVNDCVSSDGVHYAFHSAANRTFGTGVFALNEDDITNVTINSKTSEYIAQNVRYASDKEKYQVPLTPLETFLKSCKENDMAILWQYANDSTFRMVRRYLNDTEIVVYNPPENIRTYYNFYGLCTNFYNSQAYTVDSILADADKYGAPFLINLGSTTIESLGNDLDELIYQAHTKGYLLGTAYMRGTELQGLLRKGFDFAASSYNVNPFYSNYLLFDSNDENADFVTEGTILDGTISLSAGQTLECGGNDLVALGKCSLDMRFSGTVKIEFGSYIGRTYRTGNIISDGTNQYSESDYLFGNSSKLKITAIEAMQISELVYKVSKC